VSTYIIITPQNYKAIYPNSNHRHNMV